VETLEKCIKLIPDFDLPAPVVAESVRTTPAMDVARLQSFDPVYGSSGLGLTGDDFRVMLL
jgi:hypothetical protein